MTLYDTDFVSWTHQQATILRSMPGNAGLDIDHLVDEIEGLGRTAIADLSSAIRTVLTGLISRSLDPDAMSPLDSAQSEVIIRAEAGVWRHVDLDRIWRLVTRDVDGDLTERCPIKIEQLLAEDVDVAKMVSLLLA